MFKKVLCLLLALAMLAGFAVCGTAAAQETEPVEICSMVLRPGVAGVYYKCRLTEAGAARTDIVAWGVALSTQEMPSVSNMEDKCEYTRITTLTTDPYNSVLLTNVLQETNTDDTNAQNLDTVIYARAYVETADGEIIFGTGKTHTFQQLLNKVDEKFASLEPAKQQAVVTMYETYNQVMDPEQTPNMDEAWQNSQPPTEPDTPSEPSYDGDTAPEEGTTEISVAVLTSNPSADYDTNALTLWLEEQTGYNITVTAYSGNASNILTYMVTGMYEMPDLLIGFNTTASNIDTFGADGWFANLSKYYKDSDGASLHFWNAVNSNLTADEKRIVMDAITSADGNIYTVPYIATTATSSMKYQAWINTQWLDALGLQMPTNADELYTVLKAFKNGDPNGNGKSDEIPLLGSQRVNGAKVIDWLINMFVYYDSDNLWQPNGTEMYTSFLNSDYRAAMIYINKLYGEDLLNPNYMAYNRSDLKMLYDAGVVGVMLGDLYNHTNGTDVLMNYEALPLWGCAVESELTCTSSTFISGNCKSPNAAFKVLMTLYSKAGQERMRYGKYGEDWVEADANTTSKYGLTAEYKVLQTAGTTSVWGVKACTFDRYSDGALIQLTGDLTPLQQHLQTQAGNSIVNFQKAAAGNNPTAIWQGSSSSEQATITGIVSDWQTQFINGAKDPTYDNIYNWDEYWQALIDANLNNISYQMYLEYKNQ